MHAGRWLRLRQGMLVYAIIEAILLNLIMLWHQSRLALPYPSPLLFAYWVLADVLGLAAIFGLVWEIRHRLEINVSVRLMIGSIPEYLRKNPGSPFILAFILSLVFAAATYTSSQALVNDVVSYTFLLLVVGVILQAISLARHPNEPEKESAPQESPAKKNPKFMLSANIHQLALLTLLLATISFVPSLFILHTNFPQLTISLASNGCQSRSASGFSFIPTKIKAGDTFTASISSVSQECWLVILGLSTKPEGPVITTIGSQQVTSSSWACTGTVPDFVKLMVPGVYYVIFMGVRLDNSRAVLGFVAIEITRA